MNIFLFFKKLSPMYYLKVIQEQHTENPGDAVFLIVNVISDSVSFLYIMTDYYMFIDVGDTFNLPTSLVAIGGAST